MLRRVLSGVRTVGGPWVSGRWVVRRARAGLLVAMIGANVVGALVVFVLASFVVPGSDARIEADWLLLNAIAAAVYLALGVFLGAYRGTRRFADAISWLREERRPTRQEQLVVLRGPVRLTALMGGIWAGAVVLFGVLNLFDSPGEALAVVIVVAFGGITTCAIAYLLAERILREAAALAMQAGTEGRRFGPSVAVRGMLTWALGTGVPVLGLVLLGIAALAGADTSEDGLALAMICLGGIALAVGLLGTLVGVRATADPIRSVTRALARVEAGDLDTRIPVYDGTEVGQLQAGFNRMADGVRERQRLRDLFGRHVGEDVARAAIERGVDLGGETAEIAALFVDVVGSTQLAARRPPDEVVELLNRFFAVVVDVVEEHGGFVNKFEGDAALAVFGAPTPLDSCPAKALAAARTLAARLSEELPEIDAGIGVSGGEAVAGNVGAQRRYEFTVIGDPVNEAARLTELAKELDGRVAASADLIAQADAGERERWSVVREVKLRGRDAPTKVSVPRGCRESSTGS